MHAPQPSFNPSTEYPMAGINNPGMNDVLCGRGGGTNNHIGNIRFRQLVNGHKLRYLAATKSEKPMVAREVVAIWRNLNPKGRFLAQDKGSGVKTEEKKEMPWNDVGDKKAREKASQCLRERTPDVIPFVKKLELQLTLEEQEKAINLANGQVSQSPKAESSSVDNGVTKGKDDEEGLTSSEITKHLLNQQKQAAIAAHSALNAYIPPDLMKSFSATNSGDKSASISTALPHHIGSTTSAAQPSPITTSSEVATNACIDPSVSKEPDPFSSLSMQREKISQEIADLERQKARIQAEIEEKKKVEDNTEISGINRYDAPKKRLVLPDPVTSKSSQQVFSQHRDRTEMGGALPSAADLLSGFYPDAIQEEQNHTHENVGRPTLTREEYQQSVQQLMGGKDEPAAKRRNNASKEDVLDPSDFIDTMSLNSWACPPDRMEAMDAMSRHTWIKSTPSIDDVSMSSGNANPSHGLNVDQSLHESWATEQFHNLSSKRSIGQKSDSLSTLNTTYLDAMVPSQSNPKTSMLASQQRPIIRNKNDAENTASQTSDPNVRPTMFSAGQHVTGVSQMSMLSDMTGLSCYDDKSMRSLTMKAQKAFKSDASMAISEMSEAMASLDMSLRK